MMTRFLASVLCLSAIGQCLADWGEWRGSVGLGHSDATGLPTEWSEDKIYFHSEEGVTTVIEAGCEFKVVAENKLEGMHMASAAVDGAALILRTDKALYRIGGGVAK
jgi:hypothetical protein